MTEINIIGAGLAGLSAAIRLAEAGIASNLISLQPSERAQSVLAEGGINGALDTMGESDRPAYHYADTMRGGGYIADPAAVKGLTEGAPGILRRLRELGVPFHTEKGQMVLRNFGGQKLKRTAYAKSSTGKVIMTAVIDEARKYEQKGLIRRHPRHELIRILTGPGEAGRCEGLTGGKYEGPCLTGPGEAGRCEGVRIRDTYSGRLTDLQGPVILTCGGMNGIFPGRTTGTTANSGEAAAHALALGVPMGNLEMIQYHPTTIGISGKRCLVTEAARGEGGRLYIRRQGRPWYFMEELWPELGNLMPRDVVAREMYRVLDREDTEGPVMLDLTGLSREIWKGKLSDLREEVLYYTGQDPAAEPIPVEPGIHYFMGGIDTDPRHRTGMDRLYAAGECACQYHGANRLGGNSMLGALYGGRTAAEDIIARIRAGEPGFTEASSDSGTAPASADPRIPPASPVLIARLSGLLLQGLGIIREESRMRRALEQIEALQAEGGHNERERERILLARAMVLSALARKESRGAHFRSDYPDKDDDAFRATTIAAAEGDTIHISFRPAAGEAAADGCRSRTGTTGAANGAEN